MPPGGEAVFSRIAKKSSDDASAEGAFHGIVSLPEHYGASMGTIYVSIFRV